MTYSVAIRARLVRSLLLLVALSANTALAQNARFFNLSEAGTLQGVRDYGWQRHWHSVASLRSDTGARMLLFYDREQGRGKTFSYDDSALIQQLNSWDDWLTDWDTVLGGGFWTRSDRFFNSVFYRRSDGFLRAYYFGVDGSKLFRFEQHIEDPNGDALANKTGWDIVVAGRWAGTTDGLLFYHRTTGTGHFYRYDSVSQRFVRAAQYHGWRRTWDEIEVGDFNGDGADDLVLYDQDSGFLKIVSFDSQYGIVDEIELPDAGLTHGARIAVGQFGGASREDILLYQHDNGEDFENGHAVIYADSPRGARYLHAEFTTWQDHWTHLVPVDLGTSRDGLLLYSNRHDIDAWVIPMTSSPPTAFHWTPTDLARIKVQEDVMRKTYATAGLRFRLLPLRYTMQNSTLAQWACGEGHDREAADAFLQANVSRHAFPITVATESSSGAGCSNLDVEFVRVVHPIAAKTKHFAHESGHYFGLPHSHLGLSTRHDVEAFLAGVEVQEGRAAIGGDLDRDRISPSNASFLAVRDTPPTLAVSYWDNEGGGMCGVGAAVTFNTPSGSVSMRVSPHDVMAYNNCNTLYRLTRDQARAVRQSLYSTRHHLIDPDAVGPTPPIAGLFRRGDANQDGAVDISDSIFGLSFLFTGGPAPSCVDAADSNDDGSVDISDFIASLTYVFLGGLPPPSPGPNECGLDPSIDGIECEALRSCD